MIERIVGESNVGAEQAILPGCLVVYAPYNSVHSREQYWVSIPPAPSGDKPYTLDEITTAVNRLYGDRWMRPFETVELSRVDIRFKSFINPFPVHDTHKRGRPSLSPEERLTSLERRRANMRDYANRHYKKP